MLGGMSDSAFTAVALPWILKIEGGYVNDAADRGGATRHGITIGLLKAIRGEGVTAADVRALSEADAAEIYHTHFWLANGCNALPLAIALCLFDGAVNHQPATARRLLQKGLGVTADGIIGPVTRARAGRADASVFLPDYLSHRGKFYARLAEKDPSQVKFLRGWLKRLFLLQHTIYQEVYP